MSGNLYGTGPFLKFNLGSFSLVVINDIGGKHGDHIREVCSRDGSKTYLQSLMNGIHVKITNASVEVYRSSHVEVLFVFEFKLCFKSYVT